MTTHLVPNESNQVRQNNRGDLSGEIIASFNLDLNSSPGKIKVSKKLARVLSYAALGNKAIQDIAIQNDKYYIATEGKVYECLVADDPTDPTKWTETTAVVDTLDITTTFLCSFMNGLLISEDDEIHRINSNGTYTSTWWTVTVSGPALSSVDSHHMHVHKGGQETLIVCDDNEVHYYTAAAGHSTITLDEGLKAHCIDSGISAVWVGTIVQTGEHAYVYEFYIGETIDSTPVARNAYKLGSRAVLAIAVAENIPYIINELGELQAFDGAAFVTVAQLPFTSERKKLIGVEPSTIFATNTRPVSPKGMKVDGDKILIHINTSEDTADKDPANERSPGGVWEYHIRTGVLHHRQSTANSSAEYGTSRLNNTGPICVVPAPETRLLVGAGSISQTDSGLFAESDDQPHGYFVTPELEAAGAQELFERITMKAKTLSSGQKIVVKYRIAKATDLPAHANITWTSATTFTTTDTEFANIVAADGNEIEVLSGYGAGHLAHITAISENAGTYTVTIDESVGSNAQTARIRVDNWIKIADTYTSTDGELKTIGLNQQAPWIQLKVSLVGDIELRRFMVRTNPKDDA